MKLSVLACLLLFATGTFDGAQAPPVRTSTTAVLVDVNVVDKNGLAVTDLRSDDFELSEDGVRQQIASVTLVRAAAGAGAGLPTESASATVPLPREAPADASGADNGASVTAIVFDRLSGETRPIAGRAALGFVSTILAKQDYAGIYIADLALTSVQPFTNDHEALRSGVARAVGIAPANLTTKAEPFGSSRTQDL